MGRKRYIFNKKERQQIIKKSGMEGLCGNYCLFFGIMAIIFGICFKQLTFVKFILIPSLIIGMLLIVVGSFMIKSGKKKVETEKKFRNQLSSINTQQKSNPSDLSFPSNVSNTDTMTGVEFELFLKSLFEKMGYKVETTVASGDFGVDLILTKGRKIIVQAKRYKGKISVSAIQEVCAAKQHYQIFNACVVTNSYFTKPAIELADTNGIVLIDRDILSNIILKTESHEIDSLLSTQNEVASTSSQIAIYNNDFEVLLRNLYEDILNSSNVLDLQHAQNCFKKLYNITLNNSQDVISYHFTLLRVLSIIYPLKNIDPYFTKETLTLCDKDIEILANMPADFKNASMPTLTKKAIILEKQGKIAEAIEVCDFAITHEFYEENKSSFNIRKNRLITKIKK